MLRDRRIWLGIATAAVLILAWRVLMPASTPEATASRPARARAAARATPTLSKWRCGRSSSTR